MALIDLLCLQVLAVESISFVNYWCRSSALHRCLSCAHGATDRHGLVSGDLSSRYQFLLFSRRFLKRVPHAGEKKSCRMGAARWRAPFELWALTGSTTLLVRAGNSSWNELRIWSPEKGQPPVGWLTSGSFQLSFPASLAAFRGPNLPNCWLQFKEVPRSSRDDGCALGFGLAERRPSSFGGYLGPMIAGE